MLAKTTTLFDYQVETIEQLQLHYEGNRGVIVALGPGLGKTLISLLVARYIVTKETAYGQERPLPIFVVSEVSPLQDWLLTCSKHFNPPLNVEVLGSKARRDDSAVLKSWHVLQRADIIITSYEMLVQFHGKSSGDLPQITGATNGADLIYSSQCWPAFIFDEVHIVRNESTHVHAAVKDIRARYKIGLTASPCNNSASDVMAIHRAMGSCTSDLGSSEDSIRGEFERACQRSIIGGGAMSSARQHYQPVDIVIRRDFDTPEERRDYNDIHDTHVLTKIVRERQFCSGAGGSMSKTKVRMLRDYIEQVVVPRREKIVVLCEFRDSVLMLARELPLKNLRVYTADGRTTQVERTKIREQFKNCFGSAALISTSIFEQGVNLEEANHIVRFDKWWNPVPEEQGRSRIERPGQKRSVFSVLLLIENTIEDGIWLLAQKKRELIDRILRGEYILTESASSSSSSSLSSDEDIVSLESRDLVGKLTRSTIESTCNLYVENTSTLSELVPQTSALQRHTSISEGERKVQRSRSWHVKVEDMVTRSSRSRRSTLSRMAKRNRGHFNNDEDNSIINEIEPITILTTRKRTS